VRQYQLLYYLSDDTLEMYDLKNRRTFLKRTSYPAITVKHLYVGSELSVFSRQLKIVDYADPFTKDKVGAMQEKTLAVLSGEAFARVGDVVAALNAADIKINRFKTVAGGGGAKAMVMELVADGAVGRWKDMASGIGISGCDAAESVEDAAAKSAGLFGGTECVANCRDCSLALVLPHAVSEGRVGAVMQAIQASGLAITTAQTFNLNQANAAEFYEVYKGVIPEYMKKIVELTSGPCVAIEVCGEGVVGRLRDVAGPHDPDIGRVVRPSTVRAQFGLDKVKNAVHVTDLEEDGQLEVEYFFNLLARAC